MSYRELARITVEAVEEARLIRVCWFFIVPSSSTVRPLVGLTGTATELALVESRGPVAA